LRVIFRIFRESFELTLEELWNNKLRSFLSLLGITIGIFCIIVVFSSVDSLENNVRESVSQMGDKVLYVEKWPWQFGGEYPWWKYINRPEANRNDFKALQEKADKAKAVAMQFILADKQIQYKNNSVDDALLAGVTQDYNKIYDIKIERGRYFTEKESFTGDNVVILGGNLAESLFGTGLDPIGRSVRVMGRKVTVIGTVEKEGESLLSWNMDKIAIFPYNYLVGFVNARSQAFGQRVILEAKDDISLAELKDQLIGILRNVRRLKPVEENNFAINQVSILSQGLNQTFGLINLAGIFIGGFAILVGGFGIANIMFVSVRERTSLIGIKKAIGAKRIFILYEFLLESVLLCLIGGVIGLLLVFAAIQIANTMVNFTFILSVKNIVTGLLVSVGIGVISGFIPALMAARMDPVAAIRSI